MRVSSPYAAELERMKPLRDPERIGRVGKLRQIPVEKRTYMGFGAHPKRPAPAGVRDLRAWERAAKKVVEQTGIAYIDWQGRQFAAAFVIYKNVLAKYPAMKGQAL